MWVKRKQRIAVGLAILFMLISFRLFETANQHRATNHFFQHGKVVNAIILEIERPGDYVYEYIVDNVIYRTKQPVTAEQTASSLPIGSTVALLYDPDNPTYADLQEKQTKVRVIDILLIYMLSFGSLLISISAFVMMARIEKAKEPPPKQTAYERAAQ